MIPARGGSKRIPRKNIRDFCGKPLIAWTIEAAKASKLDDVLVSTEDKEIANIAISCGAMVTTRPPELATDHAASVDVALHALNAYESSPLAKTPDVIFLLQPTSPLRTAEHINAALDEFAKSGKDSLLSLSQFGKTVFALNGCAFLVKRGLLKSGKLTANPCLWLMGDPMPDIDTEEDWEYAERIMEHRQCK